jgi:HAD superfamily hydrolase (TIGR01549 family)
MRVVYPGGESRSIRAVVFDVDGTLYDQQRLRRHMLVSLASLPLRQGRDAVRVWRVIAEYRRAQERLRHEAGTGLLRELQMHEAAVASKVPLDVAARWIDEWMFERPLEYLQRCRVAGIADLLTRLRCSGMQIGALSDYEASPKLRALGLLDHFDAVFCTTDEAINAFKPHPRGFLHTCACLGCEPSVVLYVGDRVDVDAAGALAAGLPCVIIDRRRPDAPSAQCLVLGSLQELSGVLDCD